MRYLVAATVSPATRRTTKVCMLGVQTGATVWTL
jgi:hypothetical protein